ncbi:hypothetical protein KKI23_02350 [Patescibacteria group bacterium]|nr:hypothetical protein [Patescibacteria group bacterium]
MDDEQITGDGQSNNKIIIIIVVAVVLLVVGFLFMWLRSNREDNPETTNTTSEATVNGEETTETNTNTVEASTSPLAQSRDAKRVSDIRAIIASLESHLTTNEQYPMTLSELIDGGYLGTLPVNPTPGGRDYSYTPIGSAPYKSYDLCYSLETNAMEGIEVGDHCATPSGITGFF